VSEEQTRRGSPIPAGAGIAHGGAIWWDAAFLLCALVVASLRFVILRRGGAPPTIDAGNWLAFGDAILGKGVRSPTIVYPPLVPLLSKGSVALFGLTNGVALLAAVSSAAPAAGVFIALRCLKLRGASLLPTLLVLGASSVGEATAWGGFPQLIGLGLAPVALVLFDRVLRNWRLGDALAGGITFMTVFATSHMIGLIVAAAALALQGPALLQEGGVPAGWRRRVAAFALVTFPSAWLIPLYWSLATTSALGSWTSSCPNRLTWSSLLGQVEFLYRDSPWLWRILLPLGILAPLILWRRWRTPLWRVTTALLLATLVATAAYREGRFLYLLTLVAALGLAAWVVRGLEALQTDPDATADSGRPLRAVAAAGLVILTAGLGFQFVRSSQFFHQQRDHYGILTPGLVGGIQYIAASTAPGTVVAVTSLNNVPLGWWVEAIARRPTIYGAPLRWLSFDEEVRRASFANDLFVPPFPTAEKLESARNAGIEFILVPTAWTFYDAVAIDSLAGEAPDAVQRPNSDVVVIKPGALGPQGGGEGDLAASSAGLRSGKSWRPPTSERVWAAPGTADTPCRGGRAAESARPPREPVQQRSAGCRGSVQQAGPGCQGGPADDLP